MTEFDEISLPSPEHIRIVLSELNPSAKFEPEIYDEALIGYTWRNPADLPVAVYDATLCRRIASHHMGRKVDNGMFRPKIYSKVSQDDPIYLEYF